MCVKKARECVWEGEREWWKERADAPTASSQTAREKNCNNIPRKLVVMKAKVIQKEGQRGPKKEDRQRYIKSDR